MVYNNTKKEMSQQSHVQFQARRDGICDLAQFWRAFVALADSSWSVLGQFTCVRGLVYYFYYTFGGLPLPC